MDKPNSKRRKQNNAHTIPKDALVKEVREMEKILVKKKLKAR